MRSLLLVLLLVRPGLALAEEDAGVPGVLTRPPALVKQVEAAYPPEQLDAGLGGTVTMEVDLGPDGKVLDARVLQSAGQAFDAAALAAVRQFEFSPAEVDGAPAAVRIQYSYTFFFRAQVVEAPLPPDAGTPRGTVNFAGRLVERGTRDPVAGAQVVVGEGEGALVAISDEDGRFELKDVRAGTQTVVVVGADYARFAVTEEVVAGRRTEVTYWVRRKVYGGYETVVRGQKERKEVASVSLKQEEIRLIPGTNGDAFKVVQNLPGVARTPYGLGFLIVRGGKAWDTKVYIDEALVPILFHFGGLFSTYNANLLSGLDFQAGNFNAEFGRSIGGLVKAEVRTPSQKGWHGYLDVNLADVSGLIEAPIGKDWSFAVSGRRSYLEVVLPTVLSLIPGATDAIGFTVAPRYYDYQARLEYHPQNSRTRFFVNFFGSNDKLVALLPNPALDPEGRNTFGTSIAYNRLLFGYETQLSPRVDFRTRTTLGVDAYEFNLGSDLYGKSTVFPMLTRNTFTIEVPELRSTVFTGADVYALPYTIDAQSPPLFKLNQVPDPFVSRKLISEHATVFQVEPGVFLDVLVKPVEQVKVVAGVRADFNSTMKKAWVDPRLAAFWNLGQMFTVKGGVGIYHQAPDYRQGELSPKFGNPNLLPEGARQYMVGLEARFTDAISLDVQLYYKDLFDQARSTLAIGAGGDLNVDTVDLRYTSIGKGRSYGAELLLRHALTKNFFGWIAYSLSRTERDYLGGTQWGLSQFDQPHNLVVVASYKLPLDFIVGAKLRYTSGPLTTPILGSIYDANGNYYFPIIGPQNSRRLPDFFQLDLRVDKRFVFRDWMFAVYLDVQNVTNRQNVEAVLNSFDFSQQAYLTGLPILPVLGVRAEW